MRQSSRFPRRDRLPSFSARVRARWTCCRRGLPSRAWRTAAPSPAKLAAGSCSSLQQRASRRCYPWLTGRSTGGARVSSSAPSLVADAQTTVRSWISTETVPQQSELTVVASCRGTRSPRRHWNRPRSAPVTIRALWPRASDSYGVRANNRRRLSNTVTMHDCWACFPAVGVGRRRRRVRENRGSCRRGTLVVHAAHVARAPGRLTDMAPRAS